jgi:glyoxylase-like metal-dependent hydrolase (beta-lactamase superfamily II)
MNIDVEELADALSGIQVDVWGDPEATAYLLTHFHYDHAAYDFKNPKAVKAHLSQCRTLAAMELFAPPTITNRAAAPFSECEVYQV